MSQTLTPASQAGSGKPAAASAASKPPAKALEVMQIVADDGVVLSAQICAANKTAQARAVLLHGTGLNSNLYVQFARMLAMLGVEVAALDMRGHGLSQGERGHIRQVNQYTDDLLLALAALRARSDLPLVVLAHSGGAALLLKSLPQLMQRGPKPDAIALLAPTFGSEPFMVRRDISGAAHLISYRYGLPARQAREVQDDGKNAMQFSLANFLLARSLGLGRKRPVLRCAPVVAGELEYVYSANGVLGTSLGMLEPQLRHLRCPLLLATGEKDVFVNDASLHAILPWALAPQVAYEGWSFAAGDHFTTLFQALKPLHAFIVKYCQRTRGEE